MRKDTQPATHVQLPDDVGGSVVLEEFILIGAVVRAITEALRVETSELALGGDVVQPVSFHIRRAGRRRQQELPQASLDSRSHVLPQELAILRSKCHQHAGILQVGGVHLPAVVGAHIDRIASNHGTTVGLVSQRDTPDDVPTGARVPANRRIPGLDDCRLERGRGGWCGHDVRRGRRCSCDSSDSTQRPLCLVAQCGIGCCGRQRFSSRLRLRSDASQGSRREDSHIEEFILQRFDELRHCRLRGRTNACESLTRRPSNAGYGIAQGCCQDVSRPGRARADRRQGLRRVDADVRILVRKGVDQRADRRAGPLAQRAQGACGIAGHRRILVSQRLPQRRLDRFRMRYQIDQLTDGAPPDGGPLMM